MAKTFEVEFTERYTIRIEAETAEQAISKAEGIDIDNWEFELSDFEATDKSGMSTSELLDYCMNNTNVIIQAWNDPSGLPWMFRAISEELEHIEVKPPLQGNSIKKVDAFKDSYKDFRWFI